MKKRTSDRILLKIYKNKWKIISFLLGTLSFLLAWYGFYPSKFHYTMQVIGIENKEYFNPQLELKKINCWEYLFCSKDNCPDPLINEKYGCYSLKLNFSTNTQIKDFTLTLDSLNNNFIDAKELLFLYPSKVCLDHNIIILNKSQEWFGTNKYYGNWVYEIGINPLDKDLKIGKDQYVHGSNRLYIQKEDPKDKEVIGYNIYTAPELIMAYYALNKSFAKWEYIPHENTLCWKMEWTMNDDGLEIKKEEYSDNWKNCSNEEDSIIVPEYEMKCVEN